MSGKTKDKLDVGDKVRFVFGSGPVEATVIEDRGPLAPDGQRLYRVRFPLSGIDETLEVELPVSEMLSYRKSA